jgi:uncharacterized protein affecting Mg2+/Co2+ transport
MPPVSLLRPGISTTPWRHLKPSAPPAAPVSSPYGRSTPYRAITKGIAVSVIPTYLEAQSSPANSQYFWAYRVIIENQGRETVQLLSRHWMITNARGELTEVKGRVLLGSNQSSSPARAMNIQVAHLSTRHRA